MGLLSESAQAAAFGSTGMGDAVIVMFTLPDLACLAPLLVSAGLVLSKPLFMNFNMILSLIFCAVFGLLVTGSAVVAS